MNARSKIRTSQVVAGAAPKLFGLLRLGAKFSETETIQLNFERSGTQTRSLVYLKSTLSSAHIKFN